MLTQEGRPPTGAENGAAGGESANVDATAAATGNKELADLPDYTITQT